MSTGDFGSSDFIQSSINLLTPIFTLGIYHAAVRFALKPEADNRIVFSFGLKVILGGLIILFLAYPIFLQISVINDYLLFLYLLYITTVISIYLNQFARGINRIGLIGICGVLSTVIVVLSNVVLLVVFKMGAKGYLISFILANLISSAVLFIGGGMRGCLSLRQNDKQLMLDMLKYSIPLVPNTLSWWLNNTANRYIITMFCGVSQLGLFSVATRIPTILVTFQGIFIQGWQLSAINEYNEEDKGDFFSSVYKYYNLFMLMGCSILIVLSKVLATFLFAKDFYIAWKYIPFLVISVVFGAMIGFFSSIYLAEQKTNMLFITTLAGGFISVIGNLILVPLIGPMGASITSPIAYFAIWLILYMDTKRYIQLKIILWKNIAEYSVLVVEAFAMSYLSMPYAYIISIICIFFLLIININNLKQLTEKIFCEIQKKYPVFRR